MDDPVPAGSWANVGTVDVAVLSVIPDASDEILAENQFNEEPDVGTQFVMWQIAIVNQSDSENAALSDVSLSVVGTSAVASESVDSYCGVLPDPLDVFRDLFPGASLVGNVCWQVAVDDVDSLVLLADEFSFLGDRVVFDAAKPGESFDVEYPAPVPPDPDGPAGSRGTPLDIGDSVTVGDWEIVFTGVDLDATDSILEENTFNEPPAEGKQFVMVGVDASYVGEASDTLGFSVSFNAVGARGVSYTFEDTCGVIPDDINSFAEVFNGGVVSGNMCWSVFSDDTDQLVAYVSESFSFDNDKIFVGLR